jgi:hypothetical protein
MARMRIKRIIQIALLNYSILKIDKSFLIIYIKIIFIGKYKLFYFLFLLKFSHFLYNFLSYCISTYLNI